jgi:hypothetical protein
MLVRLQAEVNPAQLKQLKQFQAAAGMKTTQKDVVTNAIALLNWAAQKKVEGCSIVAVSRDGRQIEFETPFLQALALQGVDDRSP